MLLVAAVGSGRSAFCRHPHAWISLGFANVFGRRRRNRSLCPMDPCPDPLAYQPSHAICEPDPADHSSMGMADLQTQGRGVLLVGHDSGDDGGPDWVGGFPTKTI